MPINEIDIEQLPSGQIGITLEVQQIGPQGPTGPANTLSIGSVTSGETPSATLTGTAPTQTLNLVLPKGDQGEAGADALWNFRGGFDSVPPIIRVAGSINGNPIETIDLPYVGQYNGRPEYSNFPIGVLRWGVIYWNLSSPQLNHYSTGPQYNSESPELVTQWIEFGTEGPVVSTLTLTKFLGKFEVGDVVTYGGETWYCHTAYLADTETPQVPESGSPFWELIAAKGDQGDAATLTLGTVSTGAAGSNVSITNSGTSSDAVFNFTIPRGDKGEKGDQGDAATISIGTVSTGAAGSSVSITNSGTAGAAVINFSIPRGDKGETGDVGPIGPVGPEPSLNVTDNAGTSITLADTDNNKIVRCTASSAVTVTVPSTLAAGFSCMIIQAGAGQITFVQGSGATLNSFGNLLKTAGQHAPASLIRVGAGIYNLSGNLV